MIRKLKSYKFRIGEYVFDYYRYRLYLCKYLGNKKMLRLGGDMTSRDIINCDSLLNIIPIQNENYFYHKLDKISQKEKEITIFPSIFLTQDHLYFRYVKNKDIKLVTISGTGELVDRFNVLGEKLIPQYNHSIFSKKPGDGDLFVGYTDLLKLL